MQADVRSIPAVADWHAALTTYGEVLGEAMAGVDLELRRAFDWLDEQLARWRRACRDCEEEVVRAKAELAQRKFPTWDGREPDCTVQEKALRLAKARLEHAEEKVETVRRWIGRLPKLIDEVHTGPSRRLKSILEAGLPVALAGLKRQLAALESYAGLRPDHAPGPSLASLPGFSSPPPSPLSAPEVKEANATEGASPPTREERS
ncbi:MAG: hypothetical protein K2V38_10410 [Gemmataceae bacterium]|nr:hypothetical protein [Gemmataceae bacterium]